jgi:hypothetical protein
MKWANGTCGWTPNNDGLPRRDKSVEGQGFFLSSRRIAKGIGTHARSAIELSLDGGYLQFHAIANAGESGGTVRFSVVGDGRTLFESPVLRGPIGASDVDVDVSGVTTLTLLVDDGGDGYAADVANWLDARLLPKPGG